MSHCFYHVYCFFNNLMIILLVPNKNVSTFKKYELFSSQLFYFERFQACWKVERLVQEHLCSLNLGYLLTFCHLYFLFLCCKLVSNRQVNKYLFKKNKTQNLFILYWGIAINKQCCNNFRWTGTDSHGYTCIHFPQTLLPSGCHIHHWEQSSMC